MTSCVHSVINLQTLMAHVNTLQDVDLLTETSVLLLYY